MRRAERHRYLEAAFAAPTFVVLMAFYAITRSVGTVSSRATGMSLLLAAVSSGAITLAESRNNPLGNTEQGGWTNKMLFHGLVRVISFTVAFPYLPALYFAR